MDENGKVLGKMAIAKRVLVHGANGDKTPR